MKPLSLMKKLKNRLIAEDPKSAELIKPFLVGKDIKRYEPPRKRRYLILIPKGWTTSIQMQVIPAKAGIQETIPGQARNDGEQVRGDGSTSHIRQSRHIWNHSQKKEKEI